jgi:flagellar biosynthesis protein FlhG
MLDQAEKLRQIMDKTKKKNNDIMGNDNQTNAKVICITSGKGGVGRQISVLIWL